MQRAAGHKAQERAKVLADAELARVSGTLPPFLFPIRGECVCVCSPRTAARVEQQA